MFGMPALPFTVKVSHINRGIIKKILWWKISQITPISLPTSEIKLSWGIFFEVSSTHLRNSQARRLYANRKATPPEIVFSMAEPIFLFLHTHRIKSNCLTVVTHISLSLAAKNVKLHSDFHSRKIPWQSDAIMF